MTSSGTLTKPSPPASADARTADFPLLSDPLRVVPPAVQATPSAALGASAVAMEDRRVKALGLALIAAGAGLIALLSGRVTDAGQLDRAILIDAMWMSMVAANLFAIGLLVLAAGCGERLRLDDPRRRWAIGLQLLLANVLGPALLWTVIVNDETPRTEFGNWELVATVGAYALLLAAWRLWRRSRQHEALGADEAMALDPRPPILYLRSFQDDADSTIADDASAWTRGWLKILRPPSPEEELAAIFERLGPVVAIGKPGEELPELGAARLYVSHDAWQAKVQALMQVAGLVVIRVGSSPGVLWEIEQALAHIPRGRLAFAMLGQGTVAPALAARLAPVLGPGLEASRPEALPAAWTTWFFRDPRRRIGGLVGFRPDGTVHVVPVRSWPVALRDLAFLAIGRSSAPPLRKAWRDLLQATGHDVGTPARPSRALAVVLALAFGWAGAQWFYLGRRRRGIVYACTLPIAMLLSYVDALRFLWVDRAEFEARWAKRPAAGRA